MTGAAAFLYNDDFMLYQFGPRHPFQPVREKMAMDALLSLGSLDGSSGKVVVPASVDMEQLYSVHPREFVADVERTCLASGMLDQGDTPGNPGLFTGALSAVGASVRGVQGIMTGEFEHAFNPAGGLHHAHPTSVSGFCVFNDIAVAVRYLQREHGLERIAVVDTDGHHGDGTESIFYRESVLTISLHRFGRGFFPGSGSMEDRGEDEGRGYNINLPLPAGTDDNLYLQAYRAIAVPALRAYQPEIIIHQFGVDGHYRDPLVGLGLTTRGYAELSRITHGIAHETCDGRYMVVGGGGYNIDATSRSWAIMFAGLSGRSAEDDGRIAALHDQEQLMSPEAVATEVDRVIRRQEEAAIPMVEKLIRFA
ncbi:MAG: acetoin utilization protein AcuC [Methanomassiliicoccus sp.]|nr:acetoin utilization protein AcuC [Methanomassiliicoccus sp.]